MQKPLSEFILDPCHHAVRWRSLWLEMLVQCSFPITHSVFPHKRGGDVLRPVLSVPQCFLPVLQCPQSMLVSLSTHSSFLLMHILIISTFRCIQITSCGSHPWSQQNQSSACSLFFTCCLYFKRRDLCKHLVLDWENTWMKCFPLNNTWACPHLPLMANSSVTNLLTDFLHFLSAPFNVLWHMQQSSKVCDPQPHLTRTSSYPGLLTSIF